MTDNERKLLLLLADGAAKKARGELQAYLDRAGSVLAGNAARQVRAWVDAIDHTVGLIGTEHAMFMAKQDLAAEFQRRGAELGKADFEAGRQHNVEQFNDTPGSTGSWGRAGYASAWIAAKNAASARGVS